MNGILSGSDSRARNLTGLPERYISHHFNFAIYNLDRKRSGTEYSPERVNRKVRT